MTKILIDRSVVEQALGAMMATHYKMIDAGILDQDLLNKNFTAHETLKVALETSHEVTSAKAEQPAVQEPVGTVKSISGPNYENGLTAVFMHTDMNSTLKAGDPLYTTPQPAIPLPEHETEAMHEAVMAVVYQGVTRTNTDALWQAYRSAMLNAAPEVP